MTEKRDSHKANDSLTEGTVKYGNIKTKPTTLRPPPPKGQGGKTSSKKE